MVDGRPALLAACWLGAALFLGAAAGPVPPINSTACEVESCMTMPTNCGGRTECAGCGALCFSTAAQRSDPGFELFLNATGLSDQSNAASVFPETCAAALVGQCGSADDCGVCCGHAQHALRSAGCSAADCAAFCGRHDAPPSSAPPQCPWPTAKQCIQGHGNDTISKYQAGSPQAASQGACCQACAATAGCKAWQLITKTGAEEAECWTMATAAAKSGGPDSCVSGAPHPPPSPPSPTAGLIRSSDAIMQWQTIQPLPPPAPLDWSALIGACQR